MSVTSVIDEAKVTKLLEATLKAIQTEADPHLLNQYRALIRKNVSFFQRSYLAAYLLMLQAQPQGRRRRSGGGDALRGRARNNAAINGAEPGEEAESARPGQRPAQQTPAPLALPEEEATQLFINIGRSRRVFPREILGLIGAKTAVSKEDIGVITILNNYSFVQVRNSVAEELVEALNGVNFRGKTLAVNYARPRKEGDEDPAEPASKPLQASAGGVGPEVLDDDAYDGSDDSGDPLDVEFSTEMDVSTEMDNSGETAAE
jgi:hypothetical protein